VRIVADARPDVVIVDDLGAPAEAVKRITEVHAHCRAPRSSCSCRHGPGLDRGRGQVRRARRAQQDIDPVSAGTLLREIVRGTIFHCLADPTVRTGRIAQESETAHAALGLTQRELELLRLVASGATNSRLARQLFVTEQTVKFHLSNIYRKLGVANRTQASRFAYAHGLVPPAVAPDGDAIEDVVMKAA
jgi:DNA-binding NarL/FixJ family response regulator